MKNLHRFLAAVPVLGFAGLLAFPCFAQYESDRSSRFSDSQDRSRMRSDDNSGFGRDSRSDRMLNRRSDEDRGRSVFEDRGRNADMGALRDRDERFDRDRWGDDSSIGFGSDRFRGSAWSNFDRDRFDTGLDTPRIHDYYRDRPIGTWRGQDWDTYDDYDRFSWNAWDNRYDYNRYGNTDGNYSGRYNRLYDDNRYGYRGTRYGNEMYPNYGNTSGYPNNYTRDWNDRGSSWNDGDYRSYGDYGYSGDGFRGNEYVDRYPDTGTFRSYRQDNPNVNSGGTYRERSTGSLNRDQNMDGRGRYGNTGSSE